MELGILFWIFLAIAISCLGPVVIRGVRGWIDHLKSPRQQ